MRPSGGFRWGSERGRVDGETPTQFKPTGVLPTQGTGQQLFWSSSCQVIKRSSAVTAPVLPDCSVVRGISPPFHPQPVSHRGQWRDSYGSAIRIHSQSVECMVPTTVPELSFFHNTVAATVSQLILLQYHLLQLRASALSTASISGSLEGRQRRADYVERWIIFL